MINQAGRCVIQLARAPLLGKVKTRLGPVLNEQGCMAVHQALVEKTLRELSGPNAAYHYRLFITAEHPWFDTLQLRYGVSCKKQQEGDLGEKLYQAAAWALQSFEQVILIGSDCPFLRSQHLHKIFDALSNGDAASLVPATDGGYVAIGLARLDRQLFSGITWGSDRVFQQSCERLAALNWPWSAQPALADIDRPEDLGRLPAEIIEQLQLPDKLVPNI